MASRVAASTVDGSTRLTIDVATGRTGRDRESEAIAAIRMISASVSKMTPTITIGVLSFVSVPSAHLCAACTTVSRFIKSMNA